MLLLQQPNGGFDHVVVLDEKDLPVVALLLQQGHHEQNGLQPDLRVGVHHARHEAVQYPLAPAIDQPVAEVLHPRVHYREHDPVDNGVQLETESVTAAWIVPLEDALEVLVEPQFHHEGCVV